MFIIMDLVINFKKVWGKTGRELLGGKWFLEKVVLKWDFER